MLGPPEFAAKPSSQASTQSNPSPVSLIPTSTASAPRLRPCRRPHSSTASVDELSIGRDYPPPTISSPVLGDPSTQGASASFTSRDSPLRARKQAKAHFCAISPTFRNTVDYRCSTRETGTIVRSRSTAHLSAVAVPGRGDIGRVLFIGSL